MDLVKYYCNECGKWLGVKEKGVKANGIYPYCCHCKKNVKITEEEKCRRANK